MKLTLQFDTLICISVCGALDLFFVFLPIFVLYLNLARFFHHARKWFMGMRQLVIWSFSNASADKRLGHYACARTKINSEKNILWHFTTVPKTASFIVCRCYVEQVWASKKPSTEQSFVLNGKDLSFAVLYFQTFLQTGEALLIADSGDILFSEVQRLKNISSAYNNFKTCMQLSMRRLYAWLIADLSLTLDCWREQWLQLVGTSVKLS